ncbi:XkdF-like putative serine protease domain-containing protein [Domibacillus iocasae]|uniref:Terminase n=1 Tax=Domibacillus iocasae TaxID=1714016 RepID=A0A1E7DRW8_9BACI|nr:XkdF-like putative serine protease domain-containing protein [Domibacillus iocasae]OES45817.1 terminase [Domibacillus iocasae]
MTRQLVNAQITHVSYVDKAANQKQFFFTKSAHRSEPTFQKEVKVFINKEEAAQQLVYGLVYEPNMEDAHGDFMTAEEIEKAAHGFMKDARNIDKQHDFEGGVGEVVESYIAPADFTLGEQEITKGSWIMVTKASDEIWEEIQKGEITGYSMAGTAETIEKNAAEPVAPSNNQEAGLFNLLKNFFTGGTAIQKGEVRDNYEQNQQRRNLWAAWDGLDSAYYSALWDNRTPEATDFQRLIEATQEFFEIVQEIQTTGDIAKAMESKPATIQKAGKKISAARMNKINAAFDALNELKAEVEEEEDEMKAEDIQKMINDALSPISKKLADLEKEEGTAVDQSGEEEVAKQVTEALTKSLEPITSRLDAIEKTRSITKQAQEDPKEESVQKHYLNGVL